MLFTENYLKDRIDQISWLQTIRSESYVQKLQNLYNTPKDLSNSAIRNFASFSDDQLEQTKKQYQLAKDKLYGN